MRQNETEGLAFLPISHSYVSPFQSQLGARASSTVHVITFYCGPQDYVLSMSKHVRGLVCSFKSLGECAGVISASLPLSGLLSVQRPLRLLFYMHDGGTWLKHAGALTLVLRGSKCNMYCRKYMRKAGNRSRIIKQGEEAPSWVTPRSFFIYAFALLFCLTDAIPGAAPGDDIIQAVWNPTQWWPDCLLKRRGARMLNNHHSLKVRQSHCFWRHPLIIRGLNFTWQHRENVPRTTNKFSKCGSWLKDPFQANESISHSYFPPLTRKLWISKKDLYTHTQKKRELPLLISWLNAW